MNQRYSLDVNSFQKLLAAAWVVQSQRDAGIAPQQSEELERAREVASALKRASTMHAAEPPKPPVAAHGSQICIAVPATPRRLPRTVPIYAQHTAGSLALADEVENLPVRKEVSAPVLVVADKNEIDKTVRQEESAPAAAKQHDGAAPEENILDAVIAENAAREVKQGSIFLQRAWERVKDVRISVPLNWIRFPRIAWRPGAGPVYAGSLAVLLIAGNFLFSLLARSQPEPREPVQATNSSAEVRHSQPAGSGVRTVDPPKVEAAKVAPPKVAPPKADPPPALESSHLRVTDEVVADAVDALSRYEINELQRQAKYGDHVAALTLGMAYEVGEPVRQSCSEAARWIAIAAEEGSAAAQYNLALRYRNGDGTPVDLEQSKKWMSKSASRGYEKAQAALVSSGNPSAAGGQ